MKVKTIIDEDFINYKYPSMFIGTCFCDFKCCKEAKVSTSICQNEPIVQMPNIEIPTDEIFRRYSENPITSAIVIGGLEPMFQFTEIIELIIYFRKQGYMDDIVLYTGYYPDEIPEKINILKQYKNIIVKFGRFLPNHVPHFDEVLGVKLASNNQYAVRIS